MQQRKRERKRESDKKKRENKIYMVKLVLKKLL